MESSGESLLGLSPQAMLTASSHAIEQVHLFHAYSYLEKRGFQAIGFLGSSLLEPMAVSF